METRRFPMRKVSFATWPIHKNHHLNSQIAIVIVHNVCLIHEVLSIAAMHIENRIVLRYAKVENFLTHQLYRTLSNSKKRVYMFFVHYQWLLLISFYILLLYNRYALLLFTVLTCYVEKIILFFLSFI